MTDVKIAPWEKFSKKLTQIKHIQFVTEDLEAVSVHKSLLKQTYLLESYIIYLVALWEAFIEDCFSDAITLLPEGSVTAKAKDAIKNFNSPNTDGIKRLASACFIGLETIPARWGWPGFTNQQVLSFLDKILKIRHAIAHLGLSETRLSKELNFRYMMLICNIAVQTQNVLIEFMIEKGLQVYPTFTLPYPELRPTDLKL
ncbi:HEPN domain-containing protein [Spirosoma endbachense]|uniref:RiboL-PSP-HEPN domain-containing protein n=1 Tax=Spirosoma endbachense TaxID=2666025 RepID=A0A6P1VQ86_9BACT|nr:HEPN domain-containing protein [Spirosoma endbachense]QHV94855.1 hypothetical protein GJR95_07420 [Spirosoma endbachense]